MRSSHPDRSAPSGGLYRRVLARAVRRVAKLAGRLGRERAAAADGIADLVALPESERRRTVLSDARLRTWSMARQSLDLSAESRVEDAGVSEELSALGLEIAETLSARTYGRAVLEDLRSEAWGAIGNARRIRSDLNGAAAAFERARGHAGAGTGDPLEAAELAGLYATYLRDEGHFDTARHEYDTASGFYHDLGERHLEGRVLISRALLERRAGRLDDAMRFLERAPRLVDPHREPRLMGALNQNRAYLLAEMGEPEHALRVLDDGGSAFARRRAGRLDRLRNLWLRAILLRKVGRRPESRRAFLLTRDGFLRAGLPVDAARVGLDLARHALEEGDREETRRLASEAFPLLAARRLGEDTVQALELFHAAGGA